MMFWHGGGWAWWQAGLMWLAVMAFLALLIWAVYALVTGTTRRGGEPERGEQQPGSARRILDERLARGEIDAEEYQRLREMLDGGTGRSPTGTGGGR
jgi:putative membrane protein